jgi:3-phosphoshikimate 1-carboxyvinyltransferase
MTRFEPSGPLRGALRPPSDKSISHRAALIAAMGHKEIYVESFLDAADTRSTLSAVQAVGAEVELSKTGDDELGVAIKGVGLRGAHSADINVGNAGTLLRLLPGWLTGQVGQEWTLDAHENRLPPLRIRGAPLHGITYEMPIASAQVKSCLLLAGLLAEGETRVIEPLPSRDHTERMLDAAGASVDRDEKSIIVQPADRLEPSPISVPGDISSAAFFIVAASLVEGSEVALDDVNVNPTRTGLLTILERMGAEIDPSAEDEAGGEPIANLRIRSAPLQATDVGGAEIPLAIDELPLVALAACFAEGTTTIRDAEELRRKESDRIETVTAALRALGGEVEPTADGMVIEGTGGLRGGTIDSHGDHRIAMLGAVAGLASQEGVEVRGMEAAAVSYPGFERDLGSLLGG